jgi:hypothetical protein
MTLLDCRHKVTLKALSGWNVRHVYLWPNLSNSVSPL